MYLVYMCAYMSICVPTILYEELKGGGGGDGEMEDAGFMVRPESNMISDLNPP